MKLKLFLYTILLILFFAGEKTFSQPWFYDFGIGTGTHTSGESTTFLPATQTGGGTARVRVGTEGGAFYLVNPGPANGSETNLQGVSATGGEINKFSIYGYTGGKGFTIKFNPRFEGTGTGFWSFFVGSGAAYSDNNQPGGSQAFTDIYWEFTSTSLITFVRQDGSWGELNSTGNQFSKNTNYIVEIFGNNSTSTKNYVYNGSQSVAVDRWDLWIDGTLVGDDLQKDGFLNDTNIDAFMFYGSSSPSNVATIYLDNFIYSNDVYSTPLPVELTSFSAASVNGKVQLDWQTNTEVNNYGFEIEKSTEKRSWANIGFIPGHGNSNSPKDYNFVDGSSKIAGTYYYRLKQLDADGKFEYSKVINVFDNFLSNGFELEQNYPNPFNPSTAIKFSFAENTKTSLRVYNALGNEVANLFNGIAVAGRIYEMEFNAKELSSGVYYYKLEGPEKVEVKKMLLVK